MNTNDNKPSVSGEIRAVQAELQQMRNAGDSLPRTSRFAALQQNRWTPAAVAAIVASLIPLVQQWQIESRVAQEARECSAQTRDLESRVKKLERKLKAKPAK